MTPLKNTDKHFSDYLPPALVKDWRQCFRSRSAVLIFILLQCAGWLMLYCSAPSFSNSPGYYVRAWNSLGETLYLFGLVAFGLVIPCRVGATVAADTRERGSNFLMLTPLSSRCIVWGTWCSTALMVLLAAVCALPLLGVYHMLGCVEPGTTTINPALFTWESVQPSLLMLALLVLCGWVTTAWFMFTAGLPRLLQLCLLGAMGAAVFQLMVSAPDLLKNLFLYEWGDFLMQLVTVILYVADAVLLVVLALELARRHYAAPAENCSRSVRLLPLLPWGLFGLLMAAASCGLLAGKPALSLLRSQANFALVYLYFALLADALLPTYIISTPASRLWRGLPAWVQKPGLVPSSLCLALASLFYMLPRTLELLLGPEWNSLRTLQSLLVKGTQAFNLGFSILLWLLITDCLCRRSAAKRPMVFVFVVWGCSFVSMCLSPLVDGSAELESLLPLGGVEVRIWALCNSQALESALCACALNGGAFLITLMLLVCWRGRVKKP